jgi:hypothetical protein
MKKFLGMMMLIAGSAAIASAQVQAPEIDPSSMASGVVLLGGALLVISTYRRK